MTTKLQTILFACLILFSLLSQQCEATALKRGDIVTRNGHATVIKSPIGIDRIRENGVTVHTIRHLEGEKENVHKRPTSPTFFTLLAVLILNAVSLVVLLSVIPVLMNSRWSCFKSMFWIANSHLNFTLKSTRQHKHTREQKKEQTVALFTNIVVPAYAGGAILATALFLVIPEAILFIQHGISSEDRGEIEILQGTIVRFGVSLMAGYIFPLVLGTLCPRSSEHLRTRTKECVSSSELTAKEDEKRKGHQKTVGEEEKDDEEKLIDDSLLTNGTFENDSDTNGGDTKIGSTFDSKTNNSISDSDIEGDINVKNTTKNNLAGDDKNEKININYRLARSALFGNAMYNFFDGIFIGVAFLTCSNAAAVCVTAIAIYGQISQQVADYFLLTQYAGVSIPRAILLIFVASFANIVGAMMIINAGLGELAIGVLLAVASGVYLHISATECIPRVYAVVKISRDRFFALTFFIFGAIPIGLTLLHHGHCIV